MVVLPLPGITLDADHPVLRRQDQLHGVLLAGRERALVEVPLNHPASHRRGPAALTGAHGGTRLAFLGDGLRRGERVLGAGDVHAMQGPGLLQGRDLACLPFRWASDLQLW